MHSKFPYIEDLYFYKITHFHAVFFIKIIDFKAYLLLKEVIHIFLLEPNILKLNRGKNPREMSPVFLNIPPKSKMKRSFPRACSGISADQRALFVPSLPSLNEIQDGCRC